MSPLLWVLACEKNDPPQPAVTTDTVPSIDGVVPLSDIAQLNRASMAIRGIRPSLSDISLIQSDPAQLEALVDAWLDSPEFSETIKDMYAELLLLRTDVAYQLPQKGILTDKGITQGDIHHSTVESPLIFIADIIMNDRSYTEVFTADYMWSNDVLADIYGLEYNFEGPEWQQSHWTDGRPQSGLLSDSEMWRRHVSNAANYHRGRANFVSKTFLCSDIAGRDVEVGQGIDLADPEEVANAVSTNTTCVGCHDVLDPLAANWWGYKEQLQRNAVDQAYVAGCTFDITVDEEVRGVYRPEHFCYPLRFYDVEEQGRWEDELLKPPGFYGTPTEDMTDVGRLLVDDPRFSQCTAVSWFAYLAEVEREAIPLDVAMKYQTVLEDANFDIKTLIAEIVLDPTFMADRVEAGSAAYVTGLRIIRPEQLDRTLADLTGFQWLANEDDADCAEGTDLCWETVNLSRSDLTGFRSMMGGVDGYTVTHPTHSPTPTKVLAMARLAADAAGWAVETDFLLPIGGRKLFNDIELVDASEVSVRAQIAALHTRVLGIPAAADDATVDLLYTTLFLPVLASGGDAEEAWKLTLSGLLQDPAMMFW